MFSGASSLATIIVPSTVTSIGILIHLVFNCLVVMFFFDDDVVIFFFILKLISTEKRELERILRAFNIHVDNPCCVLTQEESKKFINGHEEDKYNFFLKVYVFIVTINHVV
jgi:hypothetical protein